VKTALPPGSNPRRFLADREPAGDIAAGRRCLFLLRVALIAIMGCTVAGFLPAGFSAPLSALQLKNLALEDLANVEVTSVSRRSEKLVTAAAAIEVLSADEIERAGVSQLPDALRLATGLDVAQSDGHTWAVSSRGFANTTANKMEVLLDGRSLYSPLFSGVFWDVQDTLLADIARIEVVRGPGAVQWGANAVNGVVNIITKPAEETQGSLLRALAGIEDRDLLAARYGGRFGKDGYFRVYAQRQSHDSLRFSDGTSAGDGRTLAQLGTRFDWLTTADSRLTVQADAYDGRVAQPARGAIALAGGNLLSRWSAPVGAGDRVTVQFYYDRTDRDIPDQFREERDTLDFQAQRELHLARQTIVAGVHARLSADQIGNTTTIQFLPDHSTTRLFSGFAQDEFQLQDPRWRIIFGSTLEHNSFTGVEVQPTARIAYSAGQWMAWAAVSRAVRTPSRIDTELYSARPDGTFAIVGNRDFNAEELMATELGWRLHSGQIFFADLTLFHNHYDRLRSQEPIGAGPVPFTLRNALNARTNGAELTVRGRLRPWLLLKLGWRELSQSLHFDSGSRDTTRGVSEGDDPRRIVTFHTSIDLPRNWQLDAVLRYVGARPAPAVPSYLDGDLRLGWRRNEAWDVALVGRNLLQPSHREFGAASVTAREVERKITLSATWRR
jgi:iron complex outermembrane recepter protein